MYGRAAYTDSHSALPSDLCSTASCYSLLSCVICSFLCLLSVFPSLFFFFFLMIRRPPRSTLFPYTRSSDLRHPAAYCRSGEIRPGRRPSRRAPGDRKSTRLNSSHSQISYAVFCLKKKKNTMKGSQTRHCDVSRVRM